MRVEVCARAVTIPKGRNERATGVREASNSQIETSCKQPVTKELKDMIAIPLLAKRAGIQPICLKLCRWPVRNCPLLKHHGNVDDLRVVVAIEGAIVAATT